MKIKLHHLLVAFLICLTVPIQAQEEAGTHFGVKVGMGYSTLYGKDFEKEFYPDLKPRYGFHAGFYSEFYLNRDFSVQVELMYNEQGFGFTEETELGGIETEEIRIDEIRWNLYYVNFPVLIKYYATNALTIEVGPQIGYNFLSRRERIIDAGSERQDLEIINPFDFAATGGVTYKFNFDIFLQARVTAGLNSLFDIEGADENPQIHNLYGQLSVGYRFF